MEDPCSSYIKQVERALDLPRHRRKELLQGLRAELKEKFPKASSTEELQIGLGRPEEVASALLDAVDSKEYLRFNATRLRWFRIATASLALLMVIAIGTIVYLEASEMKRAEITIIQDPIPTQYSVNLDDK